VVDYQSFLFTKKRGRVDMCIKKSSKTWTKATCWRFERK